MMRVSRSLICGLAVALLGSPSVADTAEHHEEAHDHHDDHEMEWVDPSDQAARSGIEVEAAGAARIQRSIHLHGRILPNEDRLAHVVPRYPGILLEVRKRLGDRVRRGEVLAVVQSNESLQPYTVTSLIDGTILRKHATPGDSTGPGEPIFVVADLSTVWVDLDVYRQDFDALRVGQRVQLEAGVGDGDATGEVIYISPFGAANTQTMLARVELPNPQGKWRPGLFVSGRVLLDEVDVPVTVRLSALQRVDGHDVVFVREGSRYLVREVRLGRRDHARVEVVDGLHAGELYVRRNSFVLKSELGKGAASHDH